MRILNENNEEIHPDLNAGRMRRDRILTAHHEAVERKEGSGHYVVAREYPNGGKDLEWVWDVEPVDGSEAWDEWEEIYRFDKYPEHDEEPALEDTIIKTLLDLSSGIGS